MNRKWLHGCVLLVAMVIVGYVAAWDSVRAEEKDAPVFSTWNGHLADADTCATAWLLKRFAAPNARFEFAPVGEMALPGTPFGVPQAELRVQRGKTTFEAALDRYDLESAPLLLMARIIRDIELNKWGEKVTEESKGLEAMLRGAVLRAEDDDEKILEMGSVLFDCLYADLKERTVR
jgi:hypothetical protein